jgi:hydroxyacylglutathione hydrolase
MFVQQFFVAGLGHASYLIGDESAGEAAVFDPRRDVDAYLSAARQEGLRITHVFETHLHNDFVSGARDLVGYTGAIHHVPFGAQVAYAHTPIRQGDEVAIGQLIVRALETPGHTPEHTSYSLIDTSRAGVPVAILTGGDLLVGTVGRPDLLGPELARTLAPALYHSLHDKIMTHEDYVEVYPTHGAGSLCGRGISAKRTTTIGYERRFNPALQPSNEDAFVTHVLAGDPTIPAYYARMRPTNKQGPEPLTSPPLPRPFTPQQVEHAIGHGALVLDTREPAAFAGAHIPSAVSIGLAPLFSTWVGSLLPHDVPLILLVANETAYSEATTQLRRIGYADPIGYLSGAVAGWTSVDLPVAFLHQDTVHNLYRAMAHEKHVTLLDVRTSSEWQDGHIAGALHIPLTELKQRMSEVPAGPLSVICGSGYRSTIACSLLMRASHEQLTNIIGGMEAWSAAKLPTIA